MLNNCLLQECKLEKNLTYGQDRIWYLVLINFYLDILSSFARTFTQEYIVQLKRHQLAEFVRIRNYVSLAHILNKSEIIGLLVLSTFTSNVNYGKWFSYFKWGHAVYFTIRNSTGSLQWCSKFCFGNLFLQNCKY